MERFLFGSFGAVVPDVVLLYSKRFSVPTLEFTTSQFIVATLFYMGTAGIVAKIYPYRTQTPKKWDFFAVGLVLPVILSGLIAAAERTISLPILTELLLTEHPTVAQEKIDSIEEIVKEIIGTSQEERVGGTLIDLLSIY